MGDEPQDPLGRTVFETAFPDGSSEREVAPGQGVCDFCLTPNPTWEYDCGLVVVVGNPSINASDDQWSACDRCHELIEGGEIGAMVSYMVKTQRDHIRRAGVVDLAPFHLHVRNQRVNLKAFFAARRGEARPIQ